MKPAQRSLSAVLIGEGSMSVECARILLERGHCVRGVVSPNPLVRAWATEQDLPVTDFGPALFDFLAGHSFDYLFSVVNSRILSAEVLALPRELAINFHDALLPRDAGVHASTWAVINGAPRHGVTWHVMTAGVDRGDILKQRAVPVDATDTSHALNVKCLDAGISTFAELVDELAGGCATRVAQDPSLRTYHARTARPSGALTISWRQSAEEIDAAVRATDFGPHPNEFGTVKLWCGSDLGFVVVGESELCAAPSCAPPGAVVSVSPVGVTVATVSRDVRLGRLTSLSGRALVPEVLGFGPGQRFDDLDRAEIETLTVAYRDAIRHEPYWLERLADVTPMDLPAGEASTAPAGHHDLRVEVPSGCPAASLLAATLAFLGRVTGEAGSDVGLRWRVDPGVEAQMLARTLPVRVPAPAGAFVAYCAEVQRHVDEVQEHGAYVRDLFVRYRRLHGNHWSDEGLPIVIELVDDLARPAVADPATALLVRISRAGESEWRIADAHLSERFAGHLRGAFVTFLSGLDGHDLEKVPMVTAEERHRLLVDYNDTTTPVPTVSLPELFEAQVAATPEATAVVFGGTTLTYAELNARANRLAHCLIARGVGPEQIVALALPRSPELVLSILAVLKAGASYLPLDPGYPPARIGFMLEDAAPALVLTGTRTSGCVPGGTAAPVLVLEEPGTVALLNGCAETDPTDAERIAPLTPQDPAYVIYTSGSTGRPKGVVVCHASVANLLSSYRQFVFAPSVARAGRRRLRVAHTAPFSFDASWDQLLWMLAGHELHVIVESLLADPDELLAYVVERHVDYLFATPSSMQLLMSRGLLDSDRWRPAVVGVGGEAVSGQLWDRLRSVGVVDAFNFYGPTECTVDPVMARVSDSVRPVIGRPIANTRLYVLDACLQVLPPGVAGELYIAGAGLARGYLHRPGLTAERFIADPFGAPGARMFRTGDLVRWNSDGDLEFLGRVDDQVKVRGFRIEPGEVEAVLATHPDVAQAAVIARQNGTDDKRLVAYVVATAGRDPRMDGLRDHLHQRLPAFMVPTAFVVLDVLPLTPNGKLDRQALPIPELGSSGTRREPTTPQEELLSDLFAEVLGLPSVGVDDSFFELGGDSIVAIQLVSRARRDGVAISPQDVFEHRTVAGLAAVARATSETMLETPDTGVGVVTPTPVMRWLSERGGLTDGFALGVVVRAPAGLDPHSLALLVQAVLDRHDLLRARLERSDSDGQEWALRVEPPGSVAASACVRRVDCSGLNDEDMRQVIETRAAEAIARLAPDAGLMMQVVWLDRGLRQPGRLVVMAHHLSVDGVSLRIVLENLAAGWALMAAGRAPVLDPCRTSFRRWANLLAAEAHDPARLDELATWTAMLSEPDPLFGHRALDPERDTVGLCREMTLALASGTEPLLTSVPGRFHAGVDDVLLCGLALAVVSWRRRRGQEDGQGYVLVDVEGHGRRDEAVDGVDLSRTVGWFTTLFPARLDVGGIDVSEALAGGPAAGKALRRVKEQVHALPDHGFGFGLLRHLNPETGPVLAGLAVPQIAFNYLGRFRVAAADWAVVSGFGILGGVDPRQPVGHTLEVVAWTEDRPSGPQLLTRWRWPVGLLSEDEVRELAEGWLKALDGLVNHAAGADAGGYTPSDFPLVGLSQNDLDTLTEEWMRG